jgi:hypothetical protein
MQAAQAQTALPENIGRGLQRLAELYQSSPQTALRELQGSEGLPKFLTDNRGERPLVKIYLKGDIRVATVTRVLQQLGVTVSATSSFGNGVIAAYVPLARVAEIAQMGGVRSLVPVYSPVVRIGKVTSQAVSAQNVTPVQQSGILGAGIKVGVLSDSFSAVTTPVSAQDDVKSGDLPGVANPFGYTTPVTVLEDDLSRNNTDEGRAMLQLIHDIAPGATLGFATAFISDVGFANNIIALRQSFGADVIVDDIGYFDEPFYSDGIIAQAVDQVVNSGAAYFSAAGNSADVGYEGTYTPVSRRSAQNLVKSGQQNLQISSVSKSLASSFHDFDPGSGVDISQNVTVEGLSQISFQWDEPFGIGKVKTDYNILVFNNAGKYIGRLSGIDKNLSTDQALEIIVLTPGKYQLVISKASTQASSAQKIKYVDFAGGLGGQFVGAPTIVGHPAAKQGIAVGALFYQTPTVPESFSSLGPTTIFFDNAGNRLSTPDTRQTPQIAGIDGVNTTFFFPGDDVEGDGFPNFFSTSAAAPNVAAVAALVLDAAGGSGSLSPSALYSRLRTSATDVGATGFDNLSGSGLVNANQAVQSIP